MAGLLRLDIRAWAHLPAVSSRRRRARLVTALVRPGSRPGSLEQRAAFSSSVSGLSSGFFGVKIAMRPGPPFLGSREEKVGRS